MSPPAGTGRARVNLISPLTVGQIDRRLPGDEVWSPSGGRQPTNCVPSLILPLPRCSSAAIAVGCRASLNCGTHWPGMDALHGLYRGRQGAAAAA